jgi:hypothetical protein
MPLEIRELVIRTTVTSDSAQLGDDAGGSDGSEINESAIVAACVDQVLAILQARTER